MTTFSQTVRIGLALVVAVFGTSVIPTAAASALEESMQTEQVPTTESTTETQTPTVPETPVVIPEVVNAQTAEPAEQTQSESEIPVIHSLRTFVAPVTAAEQIATVQVPIPSAPATKDICGGSGDTFTIALTTGVTYWLKGKGNAPDLQLSAGEHKTNGESKLTVVAKTSTGYVFTDNKTEKEYKLDFSIKCTICHRTASNTNPYVQLTVDEDAVDGDTANDNGQGDHYLEHLGPVFPATGSDGKWGDIIPPTGNHMGRNWDATGQALYNNNCEVLIEIGVQPGPCAPYDGSSYLTITVTGTVKDSTLVVYLGADVVYSVPIDVDKDGEIISPDFPVTVPDLAAGSYTVKVLGQNRQQILATADASIKTCPKETTPAEPDIYDECYNDRDGIYIPYVEGTMYMVNGVETSGWVSYEGADLVVTAYPSEGYVFSEGAVTEWTYGVDSFSDEQCLAITKTAKIASDTNLDGKIGVGDTVTWNVTVTNTSYDWYESFYVYVEDPNTELEDDGYINYLGAGESKTLTATGTITANDLTVCKVVNTATFYGWRALLSERQTLTDVDEWDDWYEPLATGSATAEFMLDCPTPGQGGGQVLGDTTTKIPTPAVLPATIPATGPTETSNIYLVFGMAMSALTYFAMRRRYQEA